MREIEKQALCGLLRDPELSLREIANKIGINYWRLYKIVDKLIGAGIVYEVAIPNFRVLGRELLVAGYGHLTKRKMISIEKMRNLQIATDFSADIFYGFAESYRGFVVGLSKNYTEVKRSLMYVGQVMGIGSLMNDENMSLSILPLELVEIPVFFDYAPILCEDTKSNIPRGMPIPEKNSLTNREKIAMYEISTDPSISTSKLAEKIGTTPQTASKIKNRLYDTKLLIRRYVPNMRALGYEVLVFAHWFTNPIAMDKIKNMSPEAFNLDVSPIIFLAYDMLEGFAIAMFKTLQESREIISFFEDFGEKAGVIAREPTILFLSFQEGVKIREHAYESIIKKL